MSPETDHLLHVALQAWLIGWAINGIVGLGLILWGLVWWSYERISDWWWLRQRRKIVLGQLPEQDDFSDRIIRAQHRFRCGTINPPPTEEQLRRRPPPPSQRA